MKKVLIYLKYYKKETILAPLFKMLEASFELFVPLVIASIIDRGIEKEDTTHILWMGCVLVLLGIIGLVCSVTAQYFSAKAATGFASRLRTVLFSHIQKLSFSQIDETGTATLITRMTSDVNQVQSGVNLVLRKESMDVKYLTIRQVLEELAGMPEFIQCHRNAIINLNYVENVDFVNRMIQMKNMDEVVEIGVTYKAELKERIG